MQNGYFYVIVLLCYILTTRKMRKILLLLALIPSLAGITFASDGSDPEHPSPIQSERIVLEKRGKYVPQKYLGLEGYRERTDIERFSGSHTPTKKGFAQCIRDNLGLKDVPTCRGSFETKPELAYQSIEIYNAITAKERNDEVLILSMNELYPKAHSILRSLIKQHALKLEENSNGDIVYKILQPTESRSLNKNAFKQIIQINKLIGWVYDYNNNQRGFNYNEYSAFSFEFYPYNESGWDKSNYRISKLIDDGILKESAETVHFIKIPTIAESPASDILSIKSKIDVTDLSAPRDLWTPEQEKQAIDSYNKFCLEEKEYGLGIPFQLLLPYAWHCILDIISQDRIDIEKDESGNVLYKLLDSKSSDENASAKLKLIKAVIFTNENNRKNLFYLLDSSHSGFLESLPYRYRIKNAMRAGILTINEASTVTELSSLWDKHVAPQIVYTTFSIVDLPKAKQKAEKLRPTIILKSNSQTVLEITPKVQNLDIANNYTLNQTQQAIDNYNRLCLAEKVKRAPEKTLTDTVECLQNCIENYELDLEKSADGDVIYKFNPVNWADEKDVEKRQLIKSVWTYNQNHIFNRHISTLKDKKQKDFRYNTAVTCRAIKEAETAGILDKNPENISNGVITTTVRFVNLPA